jgi:hypothetical protein
MCQKTPEVAVVAWLLPPGSVGDYMAVLTQEEFDDLKDPRMTDRLLHKAAAVEHLVAKWGGLLRRITSVIGRIFLKDPLDLGTERCQFLVIEDCVDFDMALGPERFDLSWHRVGTNSQISLRPGWHTTILPSSRRLCEGAGRQAKVDAGPPHATGRSPDSLR